MTRMNSSFNSLLSFLFRRGRFLLPLGFFLLIRLIGKTLGRLPRTFLQFFYSLRLTQRIDFTNYTNTNILHNVVAGARPEQFATSTYEGSKTNCNFQSGYFTVFCRFSDPIRCSCKKILIYGNFLLDRLASIRQAIFTIEQRWCVVSTLDNLLWIRANVS